MRIFAINYQLAPCVSACLLIGSKTAIYVIFYIIGIILARNNFDY